MADIRHMTPAEMIRLLNGTPLGEVFSERQLYRHRQRAGLRIGDGTTLDLLRYAGWLLDEVEARRAVKGLQATQQAEAADIAAGGTAGGGAGRYEQMKEAARSRNRSASEQGRDIGPISPPQDAARRASCEKNFRLFCEIYFPQTFYLAWSSDHLTAIAKIERAVLSGGLFAFAMPRGSGKTQLVRVAAIWAIVFGHRDYVSIIGADNDAAVQILDGIKTEFEANERLGEDFPEICVAVRKIAGIANRANGQTYRGERTHIEWSSDRVVLPTISGSKASGAVIGVCGITGRIRGQFYVRPDGVVARPKLVLIDDPQTDESAHSDSQCATRLRNVKGAVMGLGGPDVKMTVFMPCTVIREGDMAEQILDRKKHPEWQGERTKLVHAWPRNQRLWRKYAELRAADFETGESKATEFYLANREKMDAGAVMAWAERKYEDEVSAVQYAWNRRLEYGEGGFFAEFQNEPMKPDDGAAVLKPDHVMNRINGRPRGEVPLRCQYLTAFCDLHKEVIYWLVCAWQDDFTGYVVDYGTHPEQRQAHFVQGDIARRGRSMGRLYRGKGPDAAMLAGLENCVRMLLEREWPQAGGGGLLRIGKLLVDSGYRDDIVAAVEHKVGGVMEASKGLGITAGRKPISAYQKRPGQKLGTHWYRPSVRRTQEFRHVMIDTNFWKTFVTNHLAEPPGDPGALTIFGSDPQEHRLLAEHIARSETYTTTHGLGRAVNEWKPRVGRPDNHWFDCLVGCAVGASVLNIAVPGVLERRRSDQQQPLRLSDMQRKRR